ncbi:hypothetical protein BH09ACT8_BH09ACT8_53260 [soil metagenome]|jgi:hypothetical protein
MAGSDASPALIATCTTDATGAPMDNHIAVLTAPLDQPPIGGIDDLQQQAHRAHADTALRLATRAAHGQLTTPDRQAAFLAERLTHARDEIVDAASPTPRRRHHTGGPTRPGPTDYLAAEDQSPKPRNSETPSEQLRRPGPQAGSTLTVSSLHTTAPKKPTRSR